MEEMNVYIMVMAAVGVEGGGKTDYIRILWCQKFCSKVSFVFHQLFPSLQPFILPLKDCICQVFSMTDCLLLKVTAEIKSTGRGRKAKQTATDHTASKVLYQFCPSYYNFLQTTF